MPLYLKLNTRGLRLVLSTLLQSTNQSNYNEEDDKKAKKKSIEPTLSQGRNMVYGLRAQSPKCDWDQGSQQRAQGSEEWDQGSQGF